MRILDLYCGEGGATQGYLLEGHEVFGIDNDPARLSHYPADSVCADALDWLAEHGATGFDLIHASPPCTGYSRATSGVQSRWYKYDRLIAATRAACTQTSLPYVLENVYDARRELSHPILLCGRMFGLTVTDTDGTPLVLDRHRLFETPLTLKPPPHPHPSARSQRQHVAGSYGGARRDKTEARHVRRGGYVPSPDLQRQLLDTPWMTERGCQLAIPPAYTRWLVRQIEPQLR